MSTCKSTPLTLLLPAAPCAGHSSLYSLFSHPLQRPLQVIPLYSLFSRRFTHSKPMLALGLRNYQYWVDQAKMQTLSPVPSAKKL